MPCSNVSRLAFNPLKFVCRISDRSIRRRSISNIIGRLLGADGYTVINAAALKELQQNLADAKAGVSELRGAGAHTAQNKKLEILLSPQYGGMRDVPSRLDIAATSLLTKHGANAERAEGERHGLASHYARSASLVSRHWLGQSQLPPDPCPDDDLLLDYALSSNVFVPGEGNDLEIDPHRPSFSWRHLFSDPGCGIFLILGQSNAANHGNTPYTARREVYSLDFLRMHCFHASEPLPGASGTGGSIWSRLAVQAQSAVDWRGIRMTDAGATDQCRTGRRTGRVRSNVTGLRLPLRSIYVMVWAMILRHLQ
jgi:hypothetical protein